MAEKASQTKDRSTWEKRVIKALTPYLGRTMAADVIRSCRGEEGYVMISLRMPLSSEEEVLEKQLRLMKAATGENKDGCAVLIMRRDPKDPKIGLIEIAPMDLRS